MAASEDLQALYRRTVLDHSRAPHHFGRPPASDRNATGHNPLCGDKCTVYLQLTHDNLTEVSFEGTGCAICLASASIMTDVVRGNALADAKATAARVLTIFGDRHGQNSQGLPGDMTALEAVKNYPTRIRCATLAWQTLQAALTGECRTTTNEIQLSQG